MAHDPKKPVLVAVFVTVLVAVGAAASWAQGNSAAPIPTLDPLGLVGLAAAIGGAGLLGLRARRRHGKR